MTLLHEDVIRPLAMPIASEGGTVILTGNLCPNGAVLKQSAASHICSRIAGARWSSRTTRICTRASTIRTPPIMPC
jgi:dihydroxyacid dehydratase/phosphogluconate dehydratase